MSDPDRDAVGPAAGEDRPASKGPALSADAAPSAEPLAGAELDRRRFFRQFATDVFHTAATVVGAATALQRSTAEAASSILNPSSVAVEEPPTAPGAAGVGGATDGAGPGWSPGSGARVARGGPAGLSGSTFRRPGPAVGYHSAFRMDGERIVLVDQRRLPFSLVEVDCRTAIDIANEIGDRTMGGGPALGQAAALGLAFSANRVRSSRPYARRAILRAAETTLLQARPTSRPLRAAVERTMARYRAIGELDERGDAIADAMQDEADAIAFEASDDHGRLADAAATRIPRRTDRPAGILTLGATGAMAGGQFGTALGAVQAATYAEVDVHVYVLEGRPTLDGGRVTIWELAQAGISHTLITDAAAGWLLQGGFIDVALVGAEAIARNGDVANDAGTYPVAAVAGRHGVPLIVCAPLATLDPDAADGRALINEQRPRKEIVELAKNPLTLADTEALNPALDITPAGLVTAFATEEGLIEGSFERQFQAALDRRAARLPPSMAGAREIPTAGSATGSASDPAAGAATGGGA